MSTKFTDEGLMHRYTFMHHVLSGHERSWLSTTSYLSQQYLPLSLPLPVLSSIYTSSLDRLLELSVLNSIYNCTCFFLAASKSCECQILQTFFLMMCHRNFICLFLSLSIFLIPFSLKSSTSLTP